MTRRDPFFAKSLAVALLIGSLAVIIFILCGGASAHDAPKGWSYPYSCCSGYDCREVPASKIDERPEGYVIKGTGEVLA